MNSQLKKRPGSRFIREIPRDTRDGVALVQLVEVLGKSLVTDTHNLFVMFVLTYVKMTFMLKRFQPLLILKFLIKLVFFIWARPKK